MMALAQERELERIRGYQYNGFDGAHTVADLLAYPQLWTRVWMEGRSRVDGWDDLTWRPDSLVIETPDRDRASRLVEIGATWGSDGIGASQTPQGHWRVDGWWD